MAQAQKALQAGVWQGSPASHLTFATQEDARTHLISRPLHGSCIGAAGLHARVAGRLGLSAAAAAAAAGAAAAGMQIDSSGVLIAVCVLSTTHGAAAVPRPRPGAEVLGGLEAQASVTRLQLVHRCFQSAEHLLASVWEPKGPVHAKCGPARLAGQALQAIRGCPLVLAGTAMLLKRSTGAWRVVQGLGATRPACPGLRASSSATPGAADAPTGGDGEGQALLAYWRGLLDDRQRPRSAAGALPCTLAESLRVCGHMHALRAALPSQGAPSPALIVATSRPMS